MSYFILFYTTSSKSSVCFTAHVTLTATFQGLRSHRWLAVTTLDGVTLELAPLSSLGGAGVGRDRSWPTETITSD